MLRYGLEQTHAQLFSLIKSSASIKWKKGSGPKPSIASLTVTRVQLTASFFETREDIQYLQAICHLLSVLNSFTTGIIPEDICACLFPVLFQYSHVWGLAIFAAAFAIVESLRVCITLESRIAFRAFWTEWAVNGVVNDGAARICKGASPCFENLFRYCCYWE